MPHFVSNLLTQSEGEIHLRLCQMSLYCPSAVVTTNFFPFIARRPRKFQLGWAKLSNTSQTQTCRNLDYAVIGKPICANDLHIMIFMEKTAMAWLKAGA